LTLMLIMTWFRDVVARAASAGGRPAQNRTAF
jgi:hypothetical protein